jgi:hypothetical protein
MTIASISEPKKKDKYKKTNRLRGLHQTDDVNPPLFASLDEAVGKIERVLILAEAYSVPSDIPLTDTDYLNVKDIVFALCLPDNKIKSINMPKKIEKCNYYDKVIKKDEDKLSEIMTDLIEGYRIANEKIIS